MLLPSTSSPGRVQPAACTIPPAGLVGTHHTVPSAAPVLSAPVPMLWLPDMPPRATLLTSQCEAWHSPQSALRMCVCSVCG